MSGMKLYYRYVADVGLNQPMQLNKSNYRGQMGVGQVNAAKLLNAVARQRPRRCRSPTSTSTSAAK